MPRSRVVGHICMRPLPMRRAMPWKYVFFHSFLSMIMLLFRVMVLGSSPLLRFACFHQPYVYRHGRACPKRRRQCTAFDPIPTKASWPRTSIGCHWYHRPLSMSLKMSTKIGSWKFMITKVLVRTFHPRCSFLLV
jgi:hypothetical protein